jgi:hypothetical protein
MPEGNLPCRFVRPNYVPRPLEVDVRPDTGSIRRLARAPVASSVGLGSVALAGATNLQMTMPVVWALVILSAIGAAFTFGALVWTLWKYRDPATRGRRYG